ncbi:MAG: hypothetical protein ACD_54C00039G0001, partial [uncultured bacterium]
MVRPVTSGGIFTGQPCGPSAPALARSASVQPPHWPGRCPTQGRAVFITFRNGCCTDQSLIPASPKARCWLAIGAKLGKAGSAGVSV